MCEQCNDNAQCNNHAQCNCDTLDVTEILSLPELQSGGHSTKQWFEETSWCEMDEQRKINQFRNYELIFLSHPFADGPVANKKRVDFLAKEIRSNNPNAIILSPLHSFSYFDTDDMRDAIMHECYMMIERADTCVFIQYDGFLSSGQSDEIKYATELDKDIEVEEIDQLMLDKKLGII